MLRESSGRWNSRNAENFIGRGSAEVTPSPFDLGPRHRAAARHASPTSYQPSARLGRSAWIGAAGRMTSSANSLDRGEQSIPAHAGERNRQPGHADVRVATTPARRGRRSPRRWAGRSCACRTARNTHPARRYDPLRRRPREAGRSGSARSSMVSNAGVRVRVDAAGRLREGHPTLTEPDRPAHGSATVAPEPDRRVGLLGRSRAHGVSRHPVRAGVHRDRLARPGKPHQLECLVGPSRAVLVFQAKRGELRSEVADRGAEDDPAGRQYIETGHRTGGQKRIVVRQHEDVGQQPDSLWSALPRTTGRPWDRGLDDHPGRATCPAGKDDRSPRRRRTLPAPRPARPPRSPLPSGTPPASPPDPWVVRARTP